ncbi:XRE family transcriptional regulator [Dysgonomonas sp. 521]|uniref:helix-turn-helix domain-containing protein n=1 Tax=Dysgonomonas sp. 521 TaxID=2302932 RepID=UPI0013D66D67|nr:helix-turn-helix transcriptional regulator [Dysgonomonas sp. 521]NDV96589.1 XRE family transcriptional regulator [Dysgonomonas sp. 521]
MKKDESNENIHLGENIKFLMRAFRLQQNELAEKSGYSESQLSNILRKADVDDETLVRLAKGLGHGVTPEMIKAYSHEDTVSYIINNYTQNVENGGVGNYSKDDYTQNVQDGGVGNLKNDNNSTFQEGSSQVNNYVAEQAFALAEKNTRLEKLLLYHRMQTEPEAVKKEMESLKTDEK